MSPIEMKEHYFDMSKINNLEDARKQLKEILDSGIIISTIDGKYLWMEYAWVLEQLIDKELRNV
jgi:hypothetical protein